MGHRKTYFSETELAKRNHYQESVPYPMEYLKGGGTQGCETAQYRMISQTFNPISGVPQLSFHMQELNHGAKFAEMCNKEYQENHTLCGLKNI